MQWSAFSEHVTIVLAGSCGLSNVSEVGAHSCLAASGEE